MQKQKEFFVTIQNKFIEKKKRGKLKDHTIEWPN